MFPFLVLDLFPGSEYFAEQYKIPKYGNYTKSELPDSRFIHLYFRRLHQGYHADGGAPRLALTKTFVLASPWTLELTDVDYLLIRAIYSQVSTMVLFVFLALQSRWLGAISTLDRSGRLGVESRWTGRAVATAHSPACLTPGVVPSPRPWPSGGLRARRAWDSGRGGPCGPGSRWSPRSSGGRR